MTPRERTEQRAILGKIQEVREQTAYLCSHMLHRSQRAIALDLRNISRAHPRLETVRWRRNYVYHKSKGSVLECYSFEDWTPGDAGIDLRDALALVGADSLVALWGGVVDIVVSRDGLVRRHAMASPSWGDDLPRLWGGSNDE